MSLRYEIAEEGYYAVMSRFKEKYVSYLTPSNTKNPPLGTPALALDHFPFNFTDLWTVLAVAEMAPDVDEVAPSQKGSRVRAINLGLRIYALSLKQKGGPYKYEDGRATASDATAAVWSNWFAAFEADPEMWAYRIRITTGLGDQTQSGNYIRQPNRVENVLWVRASTIRIGEA